MIRRALLSVYDKRGLEPFARALAELEVELVASGGTASFLEKNGLEVTPVEVLCWPSGDLSQPPIVWRNPDAVAPPSDPAPTGTGAVRP